MNKLVTNKKELHIADQASVLFIEKGFRETSYTDIARKSNVTRTLVQYYFRKKDEFVDYFFTKLLTLSKNYAAENRIISSNPFVNLFIVGQVYFAFLLHCEDMKRFAFEILADRMLSHTLILQNFNYLKSELGDTHNSYADLEENTIIDLGGIYEYIFYCLLNSKPIDIPKIQHTNLRTFLTNINEYNKTIEDEIIANYFTEQDFESIDSYMLTAFGTNK